MTKGQKKKNSVGSLNQKKITKRYRDGPKGSQIPIKSATNDERVVGTSSKSGMDNDNWHVQGVWGWSDKDIA